MYRKMKGVVTLSFLLILVCAKAQDPTVTQRFNTPLYVNPALTGNGEKANRLNFLYRDQWREIPVPYVSALLSYDRKLLNKNNNLLGAGVQFFYDRSGDGAYSTFHPSVFLSYGRFFNEQRQAVTVGAQVGYNTQTIDATKFQFDNQYDGTGFNPSLGSGEALGSSANFVSFGVGLNFMTKMGERSKMDIGGAVHNPHEPDATFNSMGENPQYMRYVAYLSTELFMSPKWSLTPSYYFQGQNKALEHHASAFFSNYTQIRELPFKWSFGGGYRVNDAAFAYAGVQFKDFLIGASYDITTSDLADATNNKGGFEITLRYEFERRKIIDTIWPEIDTAIVMDTIVEEEIVEEVVVEPEVIEEIEIEEEVEPVVPEPTITDIIKYINEELSVVLFFDNDNPDPRTYRTTTETDYETAYENYLSNYEEYAEQLGAEEAAAWFQVVRNSRTSLDDLAEQLEALMTRGAKVEITINGYASPIGSSEYNTMISMRRIMSVELYLQQYNDGVLKPFMEDGSITMIRQLAGESAAQEDVNDDATNRKESVYSPAAAFERKVKVSAIREIK